MVVRQAGVAQDDSFTIDDSGFDRQACRGLNNPLVTVGPIVAATRECSRLSAFNDQLRPIAVIFDLVKPISAFGSFLDQCGRLELDERKPFNGTVLCSRLQESRVKPQRPGRFRAF
ncbi:hypothetical protein X751_24915 [Mesorhizobium sp. LNJC395A00]|nr:hypothetical protein X751_24915 [Mesorhizobium sp. LNJC395A00]